MADASVPAVLRDLIDAYLDGTIDEAGMRELEAQLAADDAAGLGTGFTHRLPGTGTGFPPADPNLRMVPGAGRLDVTATASDLNTRFRPDLAEFPGVRLADLGFTGSEDFEVAVTAEGIPELAF